VRADQILADSGRYIKYGYSWHTTQAQTQVSLRDAANVATKHITQDAHLKIVRKTGSRKNKKQHAVGCEYMLI
jgi:hypothetical protein